MAKIDFDIVTAEKLIYSEQIDVLIAPGTEGQLAILPNHAPLLTALQPGELTILNDNKYKQMVISGGFMEVMPDKITVLADTAERIEDIDEERAEKALKRAEEKIASNPTDVDLERALASLIKSRMRLKVARRRKAKTQNI